METADEQLTDLTVIQNTHTHTYFTVHTAELLECLTDYKRAFEGHTEDGYVVSMNSD